MSEQAADLWSLATNLVAAATAQVDALRCSDVAALDRAISRFAALSARWETVGGIGPDLSLTERAELETHLQAAAAAVAEAQRLGLEQRDQMSQRLGEAPLQRERILAYSRAMGNNNSTKSNKT